MRWRTSFRWLLVLTFVAGSLSGCYGLHYSNGRWSFAKRDCDDDWDHGHRAVRDEGEEYRSQTRYKEEHGRYPKDGDRRVTEVLERRDRSRAHYGELD